MASRTAFKTSLLCWSFSGISLAANAASTAAMDASIDSRAKYSTISLFIVSSCGFGLCSSSILPQESRANRKDAA